MSKKNTDKTPDELRESILYAALEHVPFDGWSEVTLRQAADDVGIDEGIIDLAFPGGILELIELHAHNCDLAMIAAAKKLKLNKLKIREKITELVKLRISSETSHKEAAHRTVSYLALPLNHFASLKILYRTVDLMWKIISDPSTDFNFYTKRMTLGAVYTSTFLIWLGDESENSEQTWQFLDRRIENVMQFEKLKAKCRNKGFDISGIWRQLGKKRYGN